MASKTLASKKVRILNSEKGVEIVASRNKIGNHVFYRLAYYPATVETGLLSNGIKYDVYTFEPCTQLVTLWQERVEKATPKLNGFYENLVKFVAAEFADGTRLL